MTSGWAPVAIARLRLVLPFVASAESGRIPFLNIFARDVDAGGVIVSSSMFFRWILVFWALGSGLGAATAPSAPPPTASGVEIVDVGFRSVRSPWNQADTWYEADLTIEVRAGADQPGRMLNRIKFAFAMATETVLATGSRRSYHRCEAEVVALAAGRHHVRFYLPPEIAKRDALRGPAKEWLVEIAVQGKPLAITAKNYSASLRDPRAMNEFRTRLGTESPSHDGIMRPQYLSPFDREYANDTPTFMRRGG